MVAWIVVASLTMAAAAAEKAEPPELDALRRFYLADSHVLRDYRPGKNSFVEGPDRRWGCYTKVGQRLTLLDVQGQGSLRHIWSTWRPGAGSHRLEFYLNGAERPQIVGTLDELIAAARRLENPPMPVPGFVGNREARNLFLPVPFERGLRIEMETLEPTWLIFWQIDYRLGTGLQADRRVAASTMDGRLTLRMEGDAPADAPPVAKQKPVRQATVIPAGQRRPVLEITGPAIVRRWSVRTNTPLAQHDKLDLEVCYDGSASPAVCSPLSDLFGPFRGVALWTDPGSGQRICYFPMPVRGRAVFTIHNQLNRDVSVELAADVEAVAAWQPQWGYWHARWQQTPRTTGYRQHEVLYVRGRGHWLGMALYGTGHDHGGGDFAVIDGEGGNPAFLHGINGEDYFTFAWFGRGEHHPYAIAHSNDEGRYRHHFENPYPFRQSLSIYWGTYPDLAPRSVAYWYQDSPDNTTVAEAKNGLSVEWDCFGPVPLVLDANHRPAGSPFAVLPSVADLDAGRLFECRCVGERFTAGWMKQRSIGPMLDLTYLSRHGTRIKGEVELGGMGHAFLARRRIASPAARQAVFQFSHDDPVRVLVSGREVYAGGSQNGFSTVRFPVALEAGPNEVVVQLTSFFNVNFNWAGFALRVLGE